MLRFLIRRLLWMGPTLLGITFVSFLVMRLAPGDPALMRAGAVGETTGDLTALVASFRAEHLLDRPLAVQYLHYLGPFSLDDRGHTWFGGDGSDPWGGLLALDLGHEYGRSSVSVASELGRRLQVTVPLSLLAIALSYLIAVPLGIHAAVRRGTAFERCASLLVFVLYALPVFWVGLLLQMGLGATGLGWLPVLGLHDRDAAELSSWAYALDLGRHILLPVLCLTYGSLAYLSRQMRAGMLANVGADYVRTARAKGLSERAIVLKHLLPNSALPLFTVMGQVLPALVGGSILVETVFDLPGIGRYAFEGLAQREYNVVMGTVLLSAVMTLIGFLISDLLCALVDPRIRHA